MRLHKQTPSLNERAGNAVFLSGNYISGNDWNFLCNIPEALMRTVYGKRIRQKLQVSWQCGGGDCIRTVMWGRA